jgi:UDP-2-acetamido-2,6-beta-L-arabino-hexul-4-ose reductase
VNRGDGTFVEEQNVRLALDVVEAIRTQDSIRTVVYANSIQAGLDNPYGKGKAGAASLLADAATSLGAEFVDIRLPNIFGEGCRPYYNSFVASFIDHVIKGTTPSIEDRPIRLLHVQSAAAALISALTGDASPIDGTPTSVKAVHDTLASMLARYRSGDIPPLSTDFDVQLFNSLRFALFPANLPIPLPSHADHRGVLTETVRAHGGGGQTFISTTVPGETRGEHYHLRKVERFVVVRGTARMELRKVLTDEVVAFTVSGDRPVIVDMPTMWAHNITNVGDTDLLTLFWANEVFNPEDPDTYRESVRMNDLEAVG